MSRLFVAVWPPDDLVRWLRSMDRPERPGLRWTTEDQWHVTVRFLGDVPDESVGAVAGGLGEMVGRLGPVPVRALAGPRPRGLGGRVWVLPVAGLDGLAAAVVTATSGVVPMEEPPRPFRGHLTLARTRRPGSLSGLPAPAVESRWDVRELTLVRSELRPTGARYEVVERWPLR